MKQKSRKPLRSLRREDLEHVRGGDGTPPPPPPPTPQMTGWGADWPTGTWIMDYPAAES